jgi:hypothetical protein
MIRRHDPPLLLYPTGIDEINRNDPAQAKKAKERGIHTGWRHEI